MTVAQARQEMRDRFAKAGAVPTDSDADETMARIAFGIGDASSVDDILGSGKTIPVKDNPDILNQRVRVLDWEGRFSTEVTLADGSPAPFAVIFAVDPETGEELTLSCGGEIVLAQLTRLKELGKLPQDVSFVERGRALRMVLPENVQTFEGEAIEDAQIIEG
jgi:hypothetical protein